MTTASLAVGEGGSITSSFDGVGWAETTITGTATLLGVAYGDDAFVAVGRNGALWRGAFPTPPLSGVQKWLAENFSEAERNDPSVGTLSADPGTAGISNLMRYALGLDSHLPERSALPQPLVWDGNPHRYPAIRFNRRVGADDVRLVLETSADLLVWEAVTSPVTVSSSVVDDVETLIWRRPEPIGPDQNAGFLRLRIDLDLP